jgi:hypothetical protein
MYSNMMDGMGEQMKPLADMTAVGTQAFEKLLKKHVDLAGDCLEASLSQARQLSSGSDLPAMLAAQGAFMADMGKKLFDLAKFDMDVMTETNQALAGVIESGFKSFGTMPAWMKIKPAA